MIVLELRKREEEAASRRLADAMRMLREVETEAAQGEARAAAAREKLRDAHHRSFDAARDAASAKGSDEAGTSGVVATQFERFGERRRAELNAAEAAVIAIRSGKLTTARAVEAAARAAHLSARQSLEILEKHAAKFRSSQRLIEERREAERVEETGRRVPPRPRGPGV